MLPIIVWQVELLSFGITVWMPRCFKRKRRGRGEREEGRRERKGGRQREREEKKKEKVEACFIKLEAKRETVNCS